MNYNAHSAPWSCDRESFYLPRLGALDRAMKETDEREAPSLMKHNNSILGPGGSRSW
jgi:hypothetical protein